ncbi:ABC transporter ATP-binding protein [endosymbiont GvMRE of Glomus versiforme]|uniref:ABC transporter ATP-binding protein n=1 Tax=endosymbiont GvMRE of Glomus versiforme TaxID=2039283 RepID=UPI000EE475DD|nr:ABC transporter ATP-binding protein [endosymbiont GvMRE of Glomus versiforme]RHZ36874.1 ABC transporter ATP-binding protein [endosymbiont GvMRE of Glomus versiforme]
MNYASEVKNFTKRFGHKTVVNNASFRVKKGSIHGFIGPNGAGKSTTLNAIMYLVIASGGELFIEGKRVLSPQGLKEIGDPSFNSNVGYVPAEPLFPRNMKVKSFLEFVGLLRNIPVSQVTQKLNISSLNRLSNQKCASLSTGQKKLLQLFAIDLYQPKILILDEPFNGLDPTKRTLLANKIKEVRNQGGTILMSTHILSDLQELADEVTMIKSGEIVHTGPKPDNIQKLYEEHFIQSQGKTTDDLFA